MSEPTNADALPLTGHEFSEYINHHAGKLTVGDVDRLASSLPQLRDRFDGIQAKGFPRAPEQLRFLAEVIEAFSAGKARNLPFKAVVEASLALLYLTREGDLIPDVLPEIGYLDDAAITNLVIERNADAFQEFASGGGRDWSRIAPTDDGSADAGQ